MYAMSKIWRNRIEGGTQKTADCPQKYYEEVIALIKVDYDNGEISENRLKELVEGGNITAEEYEEITGGKYE